MLPFLPETWPFSLDLLPDEAYLVGGSVRDSLGRLRHRLLHRQATYLDLDFVLPNNAVKTASTIARACGAGFVVLDEARQIARVVFDQTTVDFAQQQGESLEEDLRRRDFTINAIAYHPHRQILIDPLGGAADIARKTIRMVSYQNLQADPLRLMRAYRQAAQLGFSLEPSTQAAIAELASQLSQVSIERVRHELDALLSTPAGGEQLAAIWQNRLLAFCLPHFDSRSLEQMAAIDHAQREKLPLYTEHLRGWLKPVPAGLYRSWIKAAKLSRLVSAEISQAEAELTALKYSRSEIQAVLTLLKAQPSITAMQSGEFSRVQQFYLFKLAKESFLAVALLACSQGVSSALIQAMIERFLDPQDEIAHAQPLITGNLLIKQLKIKPGPKVGQWLKAVEMAQAEGKLHSRDEAIAWIQQHSLS
jgi:tRNA nucleotidyltransferase (CCA-adding enzyme)